MRILPEKEKTMDEKSRSMTEGNFEFFDDETFGNPTYNAEKVYISRSARMTGRVILEDEVVIWPHSSLRADEGSPFKIGRGTNIQDSVIMHGLYDAFVYDEAGEPYSILIGNHCTIAHRATIHGPTRIGKHTFVGFHAIIHNSVIGRDCYIGLGAIVNGVQIRDHAYVPDGWVVNNSHTADTLPSVPDHLREFNRRVVDHNKHLLKQYHERRNQLQKLSKGGKNVVFNHHSLNSAP